MSWLGAATAVVVVVLIVVFWPRRAKADEAPYADMANSLGTQAMFPVRGRVVLEKLPVDIHRATPLRESSQDELPGTEVQLRSGDIALGSCTADDEGYLDELLPAQALAPGNHVVEVVLEEVVIGRFALRLLPEDFQGVVVRSDIDKTYLDTAFTRKRDVAALLIAPGPERAGLPAMDRVYQSLRAGRDGTRNTPLVFLSGSPRFFKRTLESKMERDGVVQDGVLLKPFKEIAAGRARDFAPRDVVPSLKEQIGYKLLWLLRVRLEVPRGAREILLGDDSEADHVVYALYHRLLDGELTPASLDAELERLEVGPSWRDRVAALAPKAVAHVGGSSPVDRIYIHRTGAAHGAHSAEAWTVADLTLIHDGAWPLVVDLRKKGWVTESSLGFVQEGLGPRGAGPAAGASALTLGAERAATAGGDSEPD
jgi:hypothetical protein